MPAVQRPHRRHEADRLPLPADGVKSLAERGRIGNGARRHGEGACRHLRLRVRIEDATCGVIEVDGEAITGREIAAGLEIDIQLGAGYICLGQAKSVIEENASFRSQRERCSNAR